jgi:hypothetical protein
MQRIESESADCAKFLRKVAKTDSDWRVRANDSTDWCLVFVRTIAGKLGEPDEEVEVSTDIQVAIPPDSAFGERASFHDSRPVIVRRPRGIFLHGSDTQLLAKLLIAGARLSVSASSGSTSSSEHGLSFYSLEAGFPDVPYASVTIGGQVIAKDGRQLVCGAVTL